VSKPSFKSRFTHDRYLLIIGLSTGAIVGIVIALIVVLGVLSFPTYLFIKRLRERRWDPRKNRRFSIKLEEVPEVSGRLDPSPKDDVSISGRLYSKEQLVEPVTPARSIRYLEDDDLKYGEEVLGGRTRQ
jgi:hypothetical protein